MKNLKVRKKLILAYAVVIVLLIFAILVSVFHLKGIGDQVETFYDESYIVRRSANTIDSYFEAMQKSVFRAISTSDATIAQQAIQDAKNDSEIISEQMEIVKSHFTGDPQIITSLEGLLSDLQPMRDTALEYASNNQNIQAASYMEQNTIPLIIKAQEELDKLIDAVNTTGEKLLDNLASAQSSSTIVLLVLGIASISISVVFAFYITRSITSPVTELKAAAEKLAVGELNTVIQYHSRDELGALAESMRTTIANLKMYIGDIGASMSGLAKGDLSVTPKVEYQGNFVELRRNIETLIASLNDTIAQINQSAEQVTDGSDQVSSGAQALAQGATEQASSVEELAVTMGDISQRVQSNANNAENASRKATIMGDSIMESNQKMQEMIQAMGEISASSSKIVQIIHTIENIAFQTNILALNASVEAARAGSAGKGFSVVADEVRNLASKSAEASKNTAALIESSMYAVQNGTKIADETAKQLISVVQGAREIVDTIDSIATASHKQSEAISQITEGVDQISSVVQTNSATAEESAAASTELSSQAQMLKELVDKFRLKDHPIHLPESTIEYEPQASSYYTNPKDFIDSKY